MANDLGIVTGYPDGTFKPTNAVTRAEFATMMTKALAIPESALKGFKTSSFKDVASDHWAVAYLGYCNSKGIMTGYEDGTARPNQTITVNEAMTMICRALGYTNQAKELVGAWPANYIALAQQLDLYGDVAATGLTDRATAAQIVYNALTCHIRYIDADGVTRDLEDGNGNAVTMLSSLGGGEVNGGYGFVLTDELAETALINLHDYVGAFVTAYADDKGEGDIIAVDVLSTKVKGTFDGRIFTTTDGSELLFDNSRFAYSWTAAAPYFSNVGNYPLAANNNPATVRNGVVTGTTTVGLATNDDTKYTLNVNLSGKTIKEVYSVVRWNADMLDLYEDGNLDVKKATISVGGSKYNFPTDKNGDIDYAKFTLLGVSSVEKIAEDNVVEVYTTNGTDIVKLAVGTKTIEGKCTKITVDSDGNEDEYTIDGTVYAAADLALSTPVVAQTGTAWLTYDGDIAKWKETDANAGNYAVYLGMACDTKYNETTVSVKLFTKDGKTVEYDLTSASAVKNAAGANVTLPAIGAIVKYGVNSSGKANSIIVHTDRSAAKQLNTPRTLIDGIGKLASNVVVFMKDGSDWSIGEIKSVDTDYDGWLYIIKKDDDASKDIVAVAVDKQTALGYDDEYGLILSVGTAENSDGDEQASIDYFLDGVKKTGFVEEGVNVTLSGITGNSLYKIKVDSEGVITAVTLNATTSITTKALDYVVTDWDKDNKVVTASNGSIEGSFTLSSDCVIYVYDKKGNYKVGDISNIGKKKAISLYRTSTKATDEKGFNIVIISEENVN